MAKAKTTKVSSKASAASAASAKKSAAKPAMATAKKPATATAKPAKKSAKKATKVSTKSRSGDHSMQLDFGYFEMKQNGSPVGNIVVRTPDGVSSLEYYYLCNKASGGYQKYTWPGPGNPNVTTQYIYLGTVPSTFDPGQPEAFGSTLSFYPNVTFIPCDCAVGP